MSEIAVILPYFNPAGYRSHRIKFDRCLEAFDRAGLVGDVFLAGAGREKPQSVNVGFWDDDLPFMWHKERLINLAAHRLPSRYTHVVWADNDILVEPDWSAAIARAFRESKIVQCFNRAFHQTCDGRLARTRSSYLLPGTDGAVGLIWGACRSFFTEGPGLFELALAGSGDAILACGALQDRPSPSAPWCRNFRPLLDTSWSAELLTALDRWQTNLEAWLQGGHPVAASTGITVLEHGPLEGRMYSMRHGLLATLNPDEHLVMDDGRIFRWTQAGLATIEPAIRTYFQNRREDLPGEIKRTPSHPETSPG